MGEIFTWSSQRLGVTNSKISFLEHVQHLKYVLPLVTLLNLIQDCISAWSKTSNSSQDTYLLGPYKSTKSFIIVVFTSSLCSYSHKLNNNSKRGQSSVPLPHRLLYGFLCRPNWPFWPVEASPLRQIISIQLRKIVIAKERNLPSINDIRESLPRSPGNFFSTDCRNNLPPNSNVQLCSIPLYF